MRPLSTWELLSVWEHGLTQSPVQQALALLTSACPDTPTETLAKLTIGQRDTCLLTLREWTFGPQLTSLARCPACGEQLELSFNVADIRAIPESEPAEVYSHSLAEYQVQFRLPTSLDLIHLSANAGHAPSREQLLQRCLQQLQHQGQDISIDQLPTQIMEAVAEQMSLTDPQADVQLALLCPACGQGWQALFDIVTFFWSEISAWAARLLREVHTLASAYGWNETDILALSPQRRQFYLEMVHR